MKQYVLDTKRDKIFGVCSGLSNYFDIDVTLIRVAVVTLAFLSSGFVILMYIMLALLTPYDYDVNEGNTYDDKI